MKSYIASSETNDWMHQGHKSNLHPSNSDTHLSVDQILNVMNQINSSVKAGEFTSQLANAIFLLCQALKTSGQHLEQTHKNELNAVFVSLRQACCRDSGQLGTPCRLKIMELVELRAMGWRPSFAHTQYYLNRPEHLSNASSTNSNNTPEPTSTPVSAPPFGAVPLNPFTQYVPPSPAAAPMFLPELHQNAGVHQNPLQAPSFYLIPAGAGGWSRPTMVPASTAAAMNPLGGGLLPPGLGTNPAIPSPLDLDLAWMAHNSLNINKQLPLKNQAKFTANMLNVVQKVASAAKPLQLREEFTIRNCDSGKIMGVKGRRVAVVEELSKTVISFQKVDPKSRDRTLTITGSTPESIEHAKKLIQETIRRNVSPNRSDSNEKAAESDDDDDGPGISIETTKDGTLKLCCDDPQVLQAAQAALSEYLNRVGRSSQSRLSAEERELRKERRKSMPLSMAQSASTSVPAGKEWRSMTGSTPNLASMEQEPSRQATVPPAPAPAAPPEAAFNYARADIVKLRESTENDQSTPFLQQIRQIHQNLPELMRQ
uniref:KH domain-containing protein n=1 Tax=Steinernema glaseri TaxID=37863 RepID=A0A1I7YYW9_9BILA